MEMTKKVNFKVSCAMNGMTVFMAVCGELWLGVIYIQNVFFSFRVLSVRGSRNLVGSTASNVLLPD